jgi:hypothetical protein
VWTCCGLFYTDSKKRYIVRTQDYNQFVTARNTELAAYSMIYNYQGKTLGPNMFSPLVSLFFWTNVREKKEDVESMQSKVRKVVELYYHFRL